LTDDEIATISSDNLRAAYRQLRDHHVRVTIALVLRIDRMRPVYERALDWRQHVSLVGAQPHTARLIDVIDAALIAEAQE
jgi:hypothetical protein